MRVCVPRLCHGPGGGLQSLAADQGEVSLSDRGQGPERSLQSQVRKLYLCRVIKNCKYLIGYQSRGDLGWNMKFRP